MSAPTKMLSSAVEWLHDWMEGYEIPPILLDEYHLEEWMQNDMLEAMDCFLIHAFRKQKSRAVILDILRALFWELYLFQREVAVTHISVQSAVVQRLLALPQTAQKTAAWYSESRNLLTGHEFATVVYGKGKTREDVVVRKCVPEFILENEDTTVESRIVYKSPLTPFQWGWRYESVIRDIFEQEIAGGKVVDTLGRIRHPSLPRLAASPDGLVLEGPKEGRLVEIKAPISRTLTGIIPEDYYCQMQLQAEVTDVDAVEYIEVRFGTRDQYASDVEFINPASIKKPAFHKMGVILVVGNKENATSWVYQYSAIRQISEENLAFCKSWVPEGISESQILERSIWRIKDIWHTTVPRNKDWWRAVGYPAYRRFWVEVDEARSEGRFKSKLLLVDSEEEE